MTFDQISIDQDKPLYTLYWDFLDQLKKIF